MSTKPIASISNLPPAVDLTNIHPAWLAAGGYTSTSQTPYYAWQTLPADFITPREVAPQPTAIVPQSSLTQPSVPSTQAPVALGQPAIPSPSPQLPTGATTNGGSTELNQLLNSTSTLATDVSNQGERLLEAQKQL
jgi:hypothetical protein